MKKYKVLKRYDNQLVSPVQLFSYKSNKKYICSNFDSDIDGGYNGCSRGFYATDIEGLIYSFKDIPECEVWECNVGGKKVFFNQFKQRYEEIELLRQVSKEEIKRLALEEEERLGYKLSKILFPVNPLNVNASKVTDEDIESLKKWSYVRKKVYKKHISYKYHLSYMFEDFIVNNLIKSISEQTVANVRRSIFSTVGNLIYDLVDDSVKKSFSEKNNSHVIPYSYFYYSNTYESIRDYTWLYICLCFLILKTKMNSIQ